MMRSSVMSARMLLCRAKVLFHSGKNHCLLSPNGSQRFCRYISQRKGRHHLKNEADKLALPKYNTLDELCQIRRQQAQASVLIQHSNDDVALVYEKCARYGDVKVMLSYKRNEKNLVLLEYENAESVSHLMKEALHFRNNQHIPIETPFLYLPRVDNGRKRRRVEEKSLLEKNILFRELPKTDEQLQTSLARAQSISAQMTALYTGVRMSDINSRERFMICHLVEGVLKRIFSECTVYPFGSSFSGFGRHDCDLDLVCDLEKEFHSQPRKGSNGLFFLSKLRPEDSRQDQQNNLAVVADIMQFIMPQVFQVKRILRAFVPIIRFTHLTNLQCDISMENRSSHYMTELLHLYGQIDERVRPLVFSIRHWAKEVELTGHPGGLCVSNFMLTLMAVFYLQQGNCPVLPPVSHLRSKAGPQDQKAVNGEDCTFISDWTKVEGSKNKLTSEELLFGFLEFYEKFDFTIHGIDVVSGSTTEKPPETPMLMMNPIERDLNVCKNIAESEISNFQEKCRTSLEVLEEQRQNKEKSKSWGLLAFRNDQVLDSNMISMNLSNIFKDSGETSSESRSGSVDNNAVSDSSVSSKQSNVDRS